MALNDEYLKDGHRSSGLRQQQTISNYQANAPGSPAGQENTFNEFTQDLDI